LSEAYPQERIGVLLSAGLEIFNLQDLAARVRGRQVMAEGLLSELAQAPPLSRLQIPAHLGARCIARETGAEGMLSVNVSACAAGTQAVGEAFLAIRDGVLDVAVTGGYDSMVNPLGVGGFTLLEALSTQNQLCGAASRPFDSRRDGFVLGEGAGILVLEELSAARRRSAPIHAEVLGYASTLDAFRVTDPAPDQSGAVAAMSSALADARVQPGEVGYINAHGTATRKNDPAETAAIRAVLGAAAERVPVSSTKSQIGHLIGAAGAVELLATLFALEQGILPATINLEEPDPECDLDYVPRTPRTAAVRVALSNSFGFGGQNATIVVGAPR
jgi:3-oxoacyl-[acyl-carrier-protein] synthase II